MNSKFFMVKDGVVFSVYILSSELKETVENIVFDGVVDDFCTWCRKNDTIVVMLNKIICYPVVGGEMWENTKIIIVYCIVGYNVKTRVQQVDAFTAFWDSVTVYHIWVG